MTSKKVTRQEVRDAFFSDHDRLPLSDSQEDLAWMSGYEAGSDRQLPVETQKPNRRIRYIRQSPILLMGDLQAVTATNNHGYTYIAIGPITGDADSAVEIDHLEACALHEWLGIALGLSSDSAARENSQRVNDAGAQEIERLSHDIERYVDIASQQATEIERLREFLRIWMYEGNLQSFENRERFRKDAEALLSGDSSAPETTPQTKNAQLFAEYAKGRTELSTSDLLAIARYLTWLDSRSPVETTTEPPVYAMQSLTVALQADSEYAWAWHCNLAMPIMDCLKCSHTQANQTAAALMRHLFHIDIRLNINWSNTVVEVPLIIPSPEETSRKLPPREFDIDSHQGLYTEKPLDIHAEMTTDVLGGCGPEKPILGQCPPEFDPDSM